MKSTAVCHGPKLSFETKTIRILQSDKAVWVAEYLWWSNISGLLYMGLKGRGYRGYTGAFPNHVN